MRRRRFFYHYYRGKKAMSVHWKGACYVVDDIFCEVPCETKWRKRQPYLVMQGFANDVEIRHWVRGGDGVRYTAAWIK